MRTKSYFLRGMLIYCVLLILLMLGTLFVLFQFLAAYETSRPEHAVTRFISALTAYDVEKQCDSLLSSLDPNIQTRQEAEQVILNALSEKFRAVKDSSSQDGIRYNILSGSQKIGSFRLVSNGTDSYGFDLWATEDAAFDLSYLLGQETCLTVPDNANVHFLGKELSEAYITHSGIPFDMLQEFSQEGFPQQRTYCVNGYLGEANWQVFTQDGLEVTDQDYQEIFVGSECTDSEKEGLEERIYKFLDQYIAYCGSNKESAYWRLYNMKESLVDGQLFQRLYSALDGLTYGQSRGDQRGDTEIHCLKKLNDGLYYADVTYLVDTTGTKGVVRTTNHLKLLLVPSGDTFLVSDMSSY